MRYNILLCILSFSLAVSAKSSLEIFGSTSKDAASKVYLFQYYGGRSFVFDSTETKKGNFSFKLNPESTPEGVYALGFSGDDQFSFLLEKESLEINLHESNTKDSSKVLNSPANDDFKSWDAHYFQYQDDLKKLEKTFQSVVRYQKTDPEKFKVEYSKIHERLTQMNQNQDRFYYDLKNRTSSDYLKNGLSLLSFATPTSKDSFFLARDFTTDRFAHSPLYERKTQMYFLRFGNLNSNSIKGETDKLLSLTKKGSKSRDVMYYTINNVAVTVNPGYAKELVTNYEQEYPQSPLLPYAKSAIPKGPPQIGDEAPDIVLKNPEGKTVKLSSLKGKVVLLDFWASWCGPCRRESPNVVRAYHQYKDKGFTVYSVSLDSNKESWLAAIEQDGLSWPYHVSDLKRWRSEASREYQVTGIPATFLIDENGIIIGKNLRGQALFNKLGEIFKP